MKIIRGKALLINFRSNIAEYISCIVPETKDYFSSWHSHDTFNVPTDLCYILKNAIYTYPRGRIAINVIDTIDLKSDVIPDEVFYDCAKLVIDPCSPYRYVASQINVDGKFAGYYLIEINTLVLSDWTHNSETVDIFKYLWPELIKNLGLRKLIASEQKMPITEVTVGCDPEFELIENGDEVINAEELEFDNEDDSIGTDGSGDQIEIRPKPGTPIEVTQNIRRLIKQFNTDFVNNTLGDAGHIYPLGGHIHVGIERSWYPDRELITLLDDFIGRPTIKLSGDARGMYQTLGGVRKQPHGFEYRSTPAAVFHDPAIACIVMKLAKNLTQKYINEEVLSYNEVPDITDYVSMGLTKQQAKYFKKFCNGGFKSTNDLTKSWKIKTTKDKTDKLYYRPIVTFRNSWDIEVVSSLKLKFENVKLIKPLNVIMYGLGKHTYGSNKCTISGIIWDKVTTSKPDWVDQNTLQVGLSYNRRHEDYSRYFGSLLVSSIVDKIKLQQEV